MSHQITLSRLAGFLVLAISIQASSLQAPQALSPEQMDTAAAGTVQALPTQTQAIPSPSDTQTSTETATTTIEPTPTKTVTALGLPACIPNPSQYEIGLVTHVVDGDTIDVQINDKDYRVRYIGMDTPESTTEVELFGEEVTNKNRELVEGKIVTLYRDVSETDRYNRLLRFVFVDELFINYELVRQGYATVTTFPPDVACEAYYLKAQQVAVAADAGLWGIPTITPTQLPTNTPLPPTQPPPTLPPQPQPTQPPHGLATAVLHILRSAPRHLRPTWIVETSPISVSKYCRLIRTGSTAMMTGLDVRARRKNNR